MLSGQPVRISDGTFIQADEFFNRSEEDVFKERRKLEEAAQRNEKTLVCAICHQPLKIKGDRNGAISIHFAHLYDSGDCPIKTGVKYTREEIERMKYNGVKESPAHFKIKNAVADLISKDSRFSDIKIEKTFKSEGLSKEWKKPDVSAVFNNDKLVFEIQLSTTFLSVIVQRELFYCKNRTYIMWLFSEFTTNIEIQKFTEKDIIYSNNNNAFVVNDETIKLSEEAGKFLFICFYQKPIATDNGSIIFTWDKKLISMDDITFDAKSYKVFYYDSQGEKQKLQYQLTAEFIKNFEAFMFSRQDLDYEDRKAQLQKYSGVFSKRGIIFNNDDFVMHKILDAIYSLKYGRMIGYDLKNFISLANNILEYRKEYVDVFILALKHFGIEANVLSDDKKGTYKKKLDTFHNQYVTQNTRYNPLFKSLFPELPIQLVSDYREEAEEEGGDLF